MSAEQYFTIRGIANLWSVSEQTVRNLLRTGKLKGFKVGRGWRVSTEALRQYEESGQRDAAAPPTARRIVTRIV